MWIRYNGYLRLLIGIIHSFRLPISDTARHVKDPRKENEGGGRKGEKKKKEKQKECYVLLVFGKKFHESFIFVSRFHFVGLNQRRNDERGGGEKKEEEKKERG